MLYAQIFTPRDKTEQKAGIVLGGKFMLNTIDQGRNEQQQSQCQGSDCWQ
jgi:hypothetical protein